RAEVGRRDGLRADRGDAHRAVQAVWAHVRSLRRSLPLRLTGGTGPGLRFRGPVARCGPTASRPGCAAANTAITQTRYHGIPVPRYLDTRPDRLNTKRRPPC